MSPILSKTHLCDLKKIDARERTENMLAGQFPNATHIISTSPKPPTNANHQQLFDENSFYFCQKYPQVDMSVAEPPQRRRNQGDGGVDD